MQTQDGVRFHVTATSDPSAGKITVTVQADETGLSGNLTAGDVLTLISPVAGVNSDGVVADAGISGGADVESVAELLTRLLYRKRNPPTGGALHDYVIWATELPGISRAWAFDCWHGLGTVGLAWVYDQRTDIIPTGTDRESMQAYLFRHQDPATGTYVGKPGGIEVWPIPLTLAGAADHPHHSRYCGHPFCSHPEPAGAVSFGLAGRHAAALRHPNGHRLIDGCHGLRAGPHHQSGQ